MSNPNDQTPYAQKNVSSAESRASTNNATNNTAQDNAMNTNNATSTTQVNNAPTVATSQTTATPHDSTNNLQRNGSIVPYRSVTPDTGMTRDNATSTTQVNNVPTAAPVQTTATPNDTTNGIPRNGNIGRYRRMVPRIGMIRDNTSNTNQVNNAPIATPSEIVAAWNRTRNNMPGFDSYVPHRRMRPESIDNDNAPAFMPGTTHNGARGDNFSNLPSFSRLQEMPEQLPRAIRRRACARNRYPVRSSHSSVARRQQQVQRTQQSTAQLRVPAPSVLSTVRRLQNRLDSLRTNGEGAQQQPRNTLSCHLCGAMFATMQSLSQHVENMHRDGGSFSCQYCNESFPSRDALRQHIVANHVREVN